MAYFMLALGTLRWLRTRRHKCFQSILPWLWSCLWTRHIQRMIKDKANLSAYQSPLCKAWWPPARFLQHRGIDFNVPRKNTAQQPLSLCIYSENVKGHVETREIKSHHKFTALLFHWLSTQTLVPNCLNSNPVLPVVSLGNFLSLLYLNFLISKIKVLIISTW